MDKNYDWIWWIIIIALLCSAAPLGLLALVIYLKQNKKQNKVKQLPPKVDTSSRADEDHAVPDEDTVRRSAGDDVRSAVSDAMRTAGSAFSDAIRTAGNAINDVAKNADRPEWLINWNAKNKNPKPTAEELRVKKRNDTLSNKRAWAKISKVAGLIFAGLFTFGVIVSFPDVFTEGPLYLLTDVLPVSLLACLGGILALNGHFKLEKYKRFDRYQNLIQPERNVLSVHALADALGLRYERVCDDLQEMIDLGFFAFAHLDRGHGRLILSPDFVDFYDAPPRAAAAPEAVAENDKLNSAAHTQENEMLRRIRAANDAIPDPALSAKIDEIETLTRKIFRLLEERPEKAASLHSFTGYYLPQTLKLLDAYARLDSLGVEGENVTTAKAKITTALDMVVQGYRQQLDQLFRDDVVDISADIAVMEQMLARDGLSGEDLKPERRN